MYDETKEMILKSFIFRFSARLTEAVELAANFRLTLSARREKALYSSKPQFDSLVSVKLFASPAPFGWTEEGPAFKIIDILVLFINLHEKP